MKTLAELYVEVEENAKKSCESAIKAASENVSRNKATIDNTNLFICEAVSLDIGCVKHKNFYSVWEYLYPYISVKDMKDFSSLKKVVGPLEKVSIELVKKDTDLRKRASAQVEVTMKPKDKQFSHLRFQYVTKLPTSKNTKCKLVKKTVVELVCE